MEKHFKVLRDSFLKSGIPLETSVFGKLLKLSFQDYGEVEYEREGKIFSTDLNLLYGVDLFDDFMLDINFIIECKYKVKEHKWFFMNFPHSLNDSIGMRYSFSNLAFSGLVVPMLDKLGDSNPDNFPMIDFTSSNLLGVPLVNKGVELIGEKMNHDIITRAKFQSIFVSIKTHKENIGSILELFSLKDYDPDGKSRLFPSFMTISIIVTTADLFKFKKGVTLEEIEEGDFYDLVESVPGVLLDS
jgi:hypothetical protein